jgi:hypothetical protein
MHGYDEIDVNDSVTVRGEVARLSRLYERAVRTNTANNPDLYQSDGGLTAGVKLRQNMPPAPAAAPAPGPAASATPATLPPPPADPDASPATSLPVPALKKEEVKEVPKEEPKNGKAPADAGTSNGDLTKADGAAKPPEPAKDPDASPATEDGKGKGPANE